MNRHSRRTLTILVTLVVSTNIFAVGCAISGRTALPELPAAPVLTIFSPPGNSTLMPDVFQGSPYGPVLISTTGGIAPLSSCSVRVISGPALAAGEILPFDPGSNLVIGVGGTALVGGAGANTQCVIASTGSVALNVARGTYRITVRAADSNTPASADTEDYVLNVLQGFVFTSVTMGNATEGRVYSATAPTNLLAIMPPGSLNSCSLAAAPMATGDPAGTVYALPAGFAAGSASVGGADFCTITDTPTAGAGGASGTLYKIRLNGTDNNANTRFIDYFLWVNPPLAVTAFDPLPQGKVGEPYVAVSGGPVTVFSTGGNAPPAPEVPLGSGVPVITMCPDGGTLPSGLMSAVGPNGRNCVISGTPQAASPTATDFSVTLTFTDTASMTTVAGSANNTGVLFVAKADTAIAITNKATLTGTATAADEAYAVNWSVTTNASGMTPAITGTVTVTDGTGAMCSAPVATGTCTLTSTTSGLKTITASYPGDANFNAAPDDTTTHTVNTRATTTAVALNPTSVAVSEGSMVTVTVTDVDAAGTKSAPTGTVAFMSSDGTDAFTPAASCVLAAAGPDSSTCSVTVTPSMNGTVHTITGDFPVSPKHTASTGNAALTVNRRTSATAVNLNPASVAIAEASTVTVTVTDTSAAGTPVDPTGTVNIASTDSTDVFTPAASCALVPAGGGMSTCSVTVTPAASGTHTISATFPQSTVHLTSSGNAPLMVSARTTSTAVVVGTDPVKVNEGSVVTATVSDTDSGMKTAPSGTVNFMSTDGTDIFTPLASCTLAAAGPNSSSCMVTITPGAAGPRTITGDFVPSGPHSASSGTDTLTANLRTTTSAVAFSVNPVAISQGSLATVTVTDNDPAGTAVDPTGTVTLMSSAGAAFTPAASCMLVPAGGGVSACSVTVTPTAAGTDTITANFPASTVHATSSGMNDLMVNARTTTTAVALAPGTVKVNEGSTVTVTVTDTDAGTASDPTGTVNLMSSDGTDVFTPAASCTLAPMGGGVSTCSATVTPGAAGMRTITANYPATGVHAASSGNNTLTANLRTTATAVAFSLNPAAINEPSTVMVTVTDNDMAGTPLDPTGTVALMSSDGTDAFTPAASCTLAPMGGGVSTCSATVTPTANLGLHTITADFSATTIHLASSGNNALNVTLRNTMTAVTFGTNPAALDESSMVTVTVTDASAGTKTDPTGMVALMSSDAGDAFTPAATCMLVPAGGGVSSCSTTVTPTSGLSVVGMHTITANFAATAIHSASSGNNMLSVTLRSTTTMVAFASNPVPFGSMTAVTVTVTDTSGGTASDPVGVFALMSSVGTDVFSGVCTLAPMGGGVSTCMVTVTTPDAGTHAITANYPGSALHAASSGMNNLVVNGNATTTAVMLVPSTVKVNEMTTATVTVTDTVAAVPPTGTVTFASDVGTDAFAPMASCILAMASPNSSTCSVMITPATDGTVHMITASYPGDAGHDPSDNTASPAGLTVNKRTNTTAITFGTNPVVVNQGSLVTVTVTDTDGAGSPVTPTGTITLMSSVGTDGFSGACTLAQTVVGTATCSVTVTPAEDGTGHDITADFATTGVHLASTDTQTLTVNTRSTSTTLALASGSVFVNESDVVTVTVTDNDPSGTAIDPSGDVTVMSTVGTDVFSAPGATCTLTAAGGGVSTCTVTVTPAENGTMHSLTADYVASTGPTVHANSTTAAPVDLTVNLRTTTTSVSFGMNPVGSGGTTTITATVMDTAGAGTVADPAGTVAFMSDDGADVFSNPGTSCTLVGGGGGMSTCSVDITVSSNTGTHNITASYTAATGPSVHANSDNTGSPGMLNVQAIALGAFTLNQATESRAINTVSIPFVARALGANEVYQCTDLSTLPSSVVVNAVGNNCDITGMPDPNTSVASPYMISIQATIFNTNTMTVVDSSNIQMSSWTINPPLAINTAADLGEAVQNRAGFSAMIMSSGGQTPRTLSEVAGMALADDADCAGLVFTDTGMGNGTVNGTPTATGPATCSFRLTVNDTGNTTSPAAPANSVFVDFTITIRPPLTVSTTALPNALRNSVYFPTGVPGVQLTFAGGLTGSTKTWAEPTSALNTGNCAGLMLDTNTGIISGTATAAGATPDVGATCGAFNITVSETMVGNSPGGTSATQSLSIKVFGTFAYVADPANDTVEVIDTSSNMHVKTISLTAGNDPHSIAVTPDGAKAFVTLQGADAVAVINTFDNTVAVAAIDITAGGACANPKGIAIGTVPAPVNGNRAYVACDDRHVAVINTSTNAFVQRISAGTNNENLEGVAFRPDGTRVYLTQTTNNQLVVVNATTATQIDNDTATGGTQQFTLGAQTTPRGIRVVANGANVYAYIAKQNPGAGTQGAVDVVNVTNDTIQTGLAVVTTRQTGADTSPDSIAVSSDGQRVFVTLTESGSFAVLDNTVATPALLTTAPHVAVGTSPRGVTLPPGAARAYIALNGGDAVARNNDTAPFASAGANISLPGASTSTPIGIAHIPIPK